MLDKEEEEEEDDQDPMCKLVQCLHECNGSQFRAAQDSKLKYYTFVWASRQSYEDRLRAFLALFQISCSQRMPHSCAVVQVSKKVKKEVGHATDEG